MRVLINTLPLYGKGEGARTYTAGLLRALAASNADMEWHVILDRAERLRLGLAGDSRFRPLRIGSWRAPLRVAGVRFAWRNAIEQVLVPPQSWRFDAVHYLDSYGPLAPLGRVPLVVTVHDLIPLTRPDYHDAWVRRYLGGLMRRTLPRAAEMVAVSASTARDVARIIGRPTDRITVVPHGVDDELFHPPHPADRARIRAQYAIEGPYVVAVGTIEPRKNLARLVRAFGLARQRRQLSQQLVLVGKLGWGYDEVLAAIREIKPEGAVRLLGYVPRGDLPSLIGEADLLAYPSLDEGFGLPVTEAMACGTPVLASQVPAIAEVADGAAVLVEPRDELALAEALGELCADDAARQQLRAAGLARAGRYRWSQVAAEVAAVYRRAASRVSAAGVPLR